MQQGDISFTKFVGTKPNAVNNEFDLRNSCFNLIKIETLKDEWYWLEVMKN